jgi:hypothetical protein
MMTKKNPLAAKSYDGLLQGVVHLLEEARRGVARSVNAIMTATYWEIGCRIMFLFTFGPRSLLSLVLLYFLFRSGKKSLAFALGLGAATAYIALFGVASAALFGPLGQSFNLGWAMIIFFPVMPPFVDMMHQPDLQFDTGGGCCSFGPSVSVRRCSG